MRFALLPSQPKLSKPEDQELLESIKAQRGAAGLSDLDRALLYTPEITRGWKTFFSAIRTAASISDTTRELAISRLAIVNKIKIEFDVHSPLFIKASNGKATQEALEYIRDTPVGSHKLGSAGPGGLDESDIAVLEYTDGVTKDARVSDAVFQELQRHLDNKQIVDLTVLVAAYNAVSRIVLPLRLFNEI
ncbi:4-carboxymuconolactone decarboxylase-like protein [Dactylonectria macrodidyma]|uniref:4-carboxymuconolactone decarboxylase-like protein n=1 Tax=Dactylonectria macrodidyma TaxID=307937 RepID=A0A9P9I8L0_9HYPO|nr:4-carboxymuconolactone decarboxylase-like protein [Dactylonectria macrodidyma]